jgi:hypothetical protein
MKILKKKLKLPETNLKKIPKRKPAKLPNTKVMKLFKTNQHGELGTQKT